jgi:hypothetical protein
MPDDSQAISIESPFPEDTPAEPVAQVAAVEADDAEPEGAVEVAPGRRMVDVSVVAAERKRAREATEKKIRDEMAPLQEKAAKADALQQALDSVAPMLQRLKEQGQPQERAQPSPESQVSDADAEQEARDLQLYDKDSKLDVVTARKIIARRRSETSAAARQAAQEAVTPYAQQTAQQAMQQQFAAMASKLGADDILTPKELAQQFVELGPELSQHPEVAQVALERAIGRAYLQKRGKQAQAPTREPVLSEAPGGRITHDYTPSATAQKMGLSAQDLKESAKTYNPGNVSPIGSW